MNRAGHQSADERAAIESLLAFWVQAGVDVCLEAAPVNRLRPIETGDRRRLVESGPAPAAPAVMPEPAPVATPDPARAAAVAREMAAAAVDIPSLAKAIAAFDGCALKHAGARRAVFSRGAPDATLFIVGEGPGAEEDARGEPFVGRAGQLLDAMLRQADLLDRCFITNTVFWRPPQNRNPTPAEQAACAPFLERAIALVQPLVVLTFGAPAASAVLGVNEGILAARGRWRAWTSADGARQLPAMATLHPAFLLRQPEAKKKAWADLLAVADRLDRLASRS